MDIAKIIVRLLNKKGIINVGGKTKTIYSFAKQYNSNVKKIFIKKNSKFKFPLNPSMNLSKLNKII